ncbi:MAG: MoxR family ATPase [Actinomycetota bacterium]|nr:MoxR family ATPase [Actinomycetota bacterium]
MSFSSINNKPFGVTSPAELQAKLADYEYLADETLSTTIFLSLALARPLFLEGEAGVGKTEVAKALSRWLGTELIRLQCYEGIDVSQALYEWDYSKQLLHLRAAETTTGAGGHPSIEALEHELYGERFLLKRPILTALSAPSGRPPVLLIDELDRADDEFEAFLLEVLSEYSVTIPELGQIRAAVPPIVVITSNRTRDVHDALKRRCLYCWVEHPTFEREVEIVNLRAPQVGVTLARQVAAMVEGLRTMGLFKPPGVAETIDWAQSLAILGVMELNDRLVEETLGSVLKYKEDSERVRSSSISDLVRSAVKRATEG